MEKNYVVTDVNYKKTTESYEKSLFGRVKNHVSESFASFKKLGRFVYDPNIEGEVLKDVRESIKDAAKGLYHVAKEASRNLTDKDWYSRNKYYIGSVSIPIGLSIGIGILSTANHIKLDEILRSSPAVANKLSEGSMITYNDGNKMLDIMKLGNSIPYVSPSVVDVFSILPFGTRPLTFAENVQVWWHNHGGAYLEHVIPWASWGVGAAAFEHHENKKKNT